MELSFPSGPPLRTGGFPSGGFPSRPEIPIGALKKDTWQIDVSQLPPPWGRFRLRNWSRLKFGHLTIWIRIHL